PQSSTLAYSTLLGGSLEEAEQGISVDGSGRAFVIGWTRSTDFPAQNAVQTACKASPQGQCKGAAFASVLTTDGQKLLFSTYMGGSGSDRANAVSIDAQNALRLAGGVTSSDFPMTNAVQPGAPAGGDALIAKLDTGLTPN